MGFFSSDKKFVVCLDDPTFAPACGHAARASGQFDQKRKKKNAPREKNTRLLYSKGFVSIGNQQPKIKAIDNILEYLLYYHRNEMSSQSFAQLWEVRSDLQKEDGGIQETKCYCLLR